MKKRITAILLLLFAALIAIGSVTVLGPCVHADGSEAVCTRAGRGILACGCVLAVQGLLILLIRDAGTRIWLYGIALCAATVGILMPGTLFPLCKMDTMHCRAVMQPAMVILFAVELLIAAIGIVTERKGLRSTKE